ncbi:hypothetical protein MHYP_G00103430 [Metynnis hypsauchen]
MCAALAHAVADPFLTSHLRIPTTSVCHSELYILGKRQFCSSLYYCSFHYVSTTSFGGTETNTTTRNFDLKLSRTFCPASRNQHEHHSGDIDGSCSFTLCVCKSQSEKTPLGGNASLCCPYDRGRTKTNTATQNFDLKLSRTFCPASGNQHEHHSGDTDSSCRGSEWFPKYFSKGREKVEMVKVKSTTWSMEGRFSLEDDREKREFTVTIRNLSIDDGGLYWCGVDDWGPDTLTEVHLDVVPHSLSSTESSNTQNGEELEYVIVPPTEAAASYETTLSTSWQQNNKISSIGEPLALAGWLAGLLLLCGIINGIVIKVKWNKAGRTTGTLPTSGHISDRANSDHAEEDYVGMRPGVPPVGLPVNEEDSSLSGPQLPLQLHHTWAADPQPSLVYEHLRADSQQDSVYHTLDLTSR